MVVNFPFAVYLMKFFQITSFYTLLNLRYPLNVISFMKYFDSNLFNFLEVSIIPEKTLDCAERSKFETEYQGCGVVNNCFILYCQIILLLLLKLFSQTFQQSKNSPLINECINKIRAEEAMDLDSSNSNLVNQAVKQDKISSKGFKWEKLSKKLDDYLSIAFFVYFINSALLDVTMANFIQLRFAGWTHFTPILNQLWAFIQLGILFTLCSFITTIVFHLELSKTDDEVGKTQVKSKFKTWLLLRVPIKPEVAAFAKFTPEFIMVHDIFLCFFLVIFHSSATAQIIGILCLKIGLLSSLAFFPFQEKLDQIVIFVSECFHILILVFSLLIH